jgi:hypothetical protein
LYRSILLSIAPLWTGWICNSTSMESGCDRQIAYGGA